MSTEAAKKAWATRRAKVPTPQKQLSRLLLERSRWMRKETMARNKLYRIHAKLAQIAEEAIIIPPTTSTNNGELSTVFAKRKIVK